MQHGSPSQCIWLKFETPRWGLFSSYLTVSMVVTNCISDYALSEKNLSFSFSEDEIFEQDGFTLWIENTEGQEGTPLYVSTILERNSSNMDEKCKLKSDFHLPKKYVFYFNASPLKMMKNAFCYI